MTNQPCKRCALPSLGSIMGEFLCDSCVREDETRYYSTEFLAEVERQIEETAQHLKRLQQDGLGDDRRSNPTKGRAALKDALLRLRSLQAQRSLIRSVLVSRGAISRTLEEELDFSFPNAKNNEIVVWEGQRYRRQWVFEGMDAQGRNIWDGRWHPIGNA